MNDKIVGARYRLKKKIGAGSFGEIYVGENTCTHRRVAVKLEKAHCRVPQLSFESKLYKHLQGGVGIPTLHYYGTEPLHNVMVVDLLGKSLEDLLIQCHRRLTLKTVLMLADQMLTCIQYFHNKNFIHRDIKPDNFVMGLGNNANQVFIIDYGLAKKYRDSSNHQHIGYTEGKSLTGTARYASVGALRGSEQSRRDDLEALGYVWIYLLKGSLPWMGINGQNRKQKYDRICEIKAKTSFEDLCKGLPREFVKYFQIVRSLQFSEEPDYCKLKNLFRDLFMREGFAFDYKYDWTTSHRPVTTRVTTRKEVLPSAREKETRPVTTTQDVRKDTRNDIMKEIHKEIATTRIAQKPSMINVTSVKNNNVVNNNKSKREIIHPLFDNKRLIPRWIRDPKQQVAFRRVVVA
ncbi:Casein kinase I [Tritrichomonas foetus]|uniref:non-specific serine/threonine protein kinase n=1 Tax=Tritrichomonas foetus TaxID=1144522 RepID=A0A1J4K8D9_9EUKA|nr:Casein kinase I [Tritrichomonas foetus]|eukprot:OHT07475.1 Casein kinase I [Tritrichomonas foetus]